MRKKVKKKPLKFSTGDKVWSILHGYGVIVGVDTKDNRFRYNASFRDGTSLWYDGRGTEKV